MDAETMQTMVIDKAENPTETICISSTDTEILFNPDQLCLMCECPIRNVSMAGTVICPTCDCGVSHETQEKWTVKEFNQLSRNYRNNMALLDALRK